MQSQLAALAADLERAQRRLHDLDARIPDNRFAKRSRQQSWSVAECIVHLNLTSRAYVPRIRALFDDPRYAPTSQAQTYRRNFVALLLSIYTAPMLRIGGRKFGRYRTPAPFVPSADTIERRAVIAEFDALQSQLLTIVRDAEGRPLNDMRIVSPFDKRVSYNVYSALVLLAGHELRHIEQAEEVWRDRE